jgi:hypothetical protein
LSYVKKNAQGFLQGFARSPGLLDSLFSSHGNCRQDAPPRPPRRSDVLHAGMPRPPVGQEFSA